MADRKISDLTALTTPASGDYLPIVDISEASAANKNKRITIEELLRGAPDGTAGAPGFAFESDPDSGLYSTGANGVALSTGGTGRLFITSAGLVGVGTSSPSGLLHVAGQIYSSGTGYTGTNSPTLRLINSTATTGRTFGINSADAGALQVFDASAGDATRLWLDSSGRVGIGTASPSYALDVSGQIRAAANATLAQLRLERTGTSTGHSWLGAQSDALLAVLDSSFAEKMRLDSSGRLLVGTSSGRNIGTVYQHRLQIETTQYAGLSIVNNTADTGPALLVLAKSRGTSIGSANLVQTNDVLGSLTFAGADGTDIETPGASIEAYVDGTPGANDMPGRIVLSTTAAGASSPTERMRISQDGTVGIYNSSYLQPAVDNAAYLGGGTNLRWIAVYAANGTIQTSDLRQKTDIADSSLGTEFIKSLRPVSYKFTIGGNKPTGETDEDGNWLYAPTPGKRTHWGFVAQEVKQAIDNAGVDFGGWILDDPSDPDSDQGLRYDQFIAPLTKALQEALEKIETLEAKVAALEGA